MQRLNSVFGASFKYVEKGKNIFQKKMHQVLKSPHSDV